MTAEKRQIRDEDVVFVEANWKMELLHNVWFGMCMVEFSPPYSHMNTSKGFSLANPTHFRCATVSCIMAIEIVTSSLELKKFLGEDELRSVVIYHANASLNGALHIKKKNKLVERLARMVAGLPPNIKFLYFKEEKTEAASIKSGASLLNTHTVVFEDPKKFKEEEQKKKKKGTPEPAEIMGKVQHVREQDLLLGQLLASGAKAGRCVRKPKIAPEGGKK